MERCNDTKEREIEYRIQNFFPRRVWSSIFNFPGEDRDPKHFNFKKQTWIFQPGGVRTLLTPPPPCSFAHAVMCTIGSHWLRYDHLCYQYYLMKTLVVCLIIIKCIFAFRLYMYVSISLKSRCHLLMKERRDNLKIAWRHRQNDRKPSLRNICDWLIWYKFKKQNRSITMYPEYFHFNLLSLSYFSEHFCMCARSIFF